MEQALEMAMAFVGTNIDNFIMLSVLLALARTRTDWRTVCAAQYIGLAVLVWISMMGAGIVRLFPMQLVRLLGFLPMAIGLYGLSCSRGAEEEEDVIPPLWTQTALNLSGGMDNISVYIPLLEGYEGVRPFLLLASIFAGLMSLWCWLAGRIACLPGLRERIGRHAGRMIPWVYILLGIYILIR